MKLKDRDIGSGMTRTTVLALARARELLKLKDENEKLKVQILEQTARANRAERIIKQRLPGIMIWDEVVDLVPYQAEIERSRVQDSEPERTVD